MKRDILFRGICVHKLEWLYGDLEQRQYNFRIGGYEITPPTPFDPCGDTVYLYSTVFGNSVGQFTGMLDKNGVRIFEGDICRAKKSNSYLDGVFVIKWNLKQGRWGYWDEEKGKFSKHQVGCAGNLYCLVIGNEYQNSDLLKESNK